MKSPRRFILCATDFSPPAVAAASIAAKLALRRAEGLRVAYATGGMGADLKADAKRRLAAEAARLRQTGVEVESLLLQGGNPVTALLDAIRAEPPVLVIVGSGVKGAVDRWALGSFSEQIAESAPVPTLVIRNPEAFENWDWTKGRLKILLALDRQATSDVVLRWAKEFQRAGPCDLVTCHINRRMPTVEETAAVPGRPVNPPALQSRLEREIRKKVRDQLGDDASDVIVRPFFGDPASCIMEIAREVKAPLIAVGAHQRRGLSRLGQFSVSRELLHIVGGNVVCVPVSAKFDPREAHLPDFRRVLVATDFSELGNAAVPYACAACAIGGLVRIIHVAPPRRKTAPRDAANLHEQLTGLIPNETGARCQPPEVAVLEEKDPADAICREAERFGADIVCLASHGLGVSRALHGSVTKAVLKQIRRPLLVIRRPDE
ncbi:MAG: hypothetical protein RIQ93_350 [Verrucomicrobiota bacterium]|jgi:nucleotide-binding universal stress UspA family protein